jgi:hypothetical protein
LASTIDNATQTIVDFVEGRLSAKAFEQIVYNYPALESVLRDESLKWHDSYIKSNPYEFLIGLDYDDPAGRLP